MKLRPSTHYSGPAGKPVALVDFEDGPQVLSFHRSQKSAGRTAELLEEIAAFAGPLYSGSDLYALAVEAARASYRSGALGELTVRQRRKVVDEVRSELRRRKQLSSPEY